jgi:hypothetical protein
MNDFSLDDVIRVKNKQSVEGNLLYTKSTIQSSKIETPR